MMLFIALCLGLSVTNCAAGDTVYMVNNENSNNGTMTLYKVDIISQNAEQVTTLHTGPRQPLPFVFGATVCDNVYYGFWADITFPAFGIVQIPLDGDHEVTYLDIPVLYHTIECDPHDSNSLFAVGSVAGDPAQFTFRKYDIQAQTDSVIADIPQIGFLGFDSVFSFNADVTKLYVGGGTDTGVSKGFQLILDTATGNVTYGPAKYERGILPYLILPDTKPMQGVIMTGGLNNPQHFWAEIILDDEKVAVKKGASIENTFYDTVSPAVCGKHMYTANLAFSPKWQLFQIDTGTGKVLTTVDLNFERNNHMVAGFACVSN